VANHSDVVKVNEQMIVFVTLSFVLIRTTHDGAHASQQFPD
jgi:hypothetical protein